MFLLQSSCPSGACAISWGLRRLDIWLFSRINGIDFPGSDLLLGWPTWLGDATVAPLLALAGLLLLDRSRFRSRLLFVLGAMLLSTLIVHALKVMIDRPRPLAELSGLLDDGSPMRVLFRELRQHSMPSGHTQAVFGLAAAFSLLSDGRLRWLFAIALWVGITRIYVGAHFPLDVLVGATIGLLGVDLMAKIWLPRDLRPQADKR